MEARRDTLITEREALLPLHPAGDQMKLYMSIFNKKGGAALSAVKGDFCAMCHVRIRPQMLNEIRDTDQDLPLRELRPHPLLDRQAGSPSGTQVRMTGGRSGIRPHPQPKARR